MKYGLIGEKLSHSFSKTIHNMLGNSDYELCELAPAQLDSFMQAREFLGINVTIPYKQSVIKHLDYIDSVAKEIGAVNTVVNKNGKLYGYNTDFYGMRELILTNGICLKDKTVAILGGGGTSKTANAVCKSLLTKKVYTVSRTPELSQIDYGTLEKLQSSIDVIINTTPVGMYPKCDACAVDIQGFENLSGVIDVIYNPLSTKLVLDAKLKNIKSGGGLYMLVCQAVFANDLFFDTKTNTAVTNEIYKTLYNQKRNIVLIGMPSSGKTTIGKELAKSLGKQFVDSDEQILKAQGKSAAQIINECGENAFREIESDIIKELSKACGTVIATGGGVIKRAQNIEALKQNGTVVFVDRAFSSLIPTTDRPLSSNKAALSKLYTERLPLYKAAADITLDASDDVTDNVRRITKCL